MPPRLMVGDPACGTGLKLGDLYVVFNPGRSVVAEAVCCIVFAASFFLGQF